MKKVTHLTLLLLSLTLSTFALQAQSASVYDQVENACKDIVQMNGNVNSTLGGVTPSSMDPSTHPAMAAILGQLSLLVADGENGLGKLSASEFVALRGQLTAAFSTFASHGSSLCYCIVSGDLVGANNMKTTVRNDFQALRLVASDIRAEIQKAKGKS